MTKEELLEMVDATINENGTRNITGKALNLALTEIINAMGTGNGGGALTIYFAGGQETEEQKAANILVREQCRVIAETGGVLPVINVDMSGMYTTMVGAGIAASYVALGAAYDTTGAMMGGEPSFIVFIYEGGQMPLLVNTDGTITPMNGMSTLSINR